MPPPELQLLLVPLFLVLPVLLAAAKPTLPHAGVPASSPTRRPWPEQFHAVLLTNLTDSGGRLELIDVYYDWPRGRSLNVVREQLSSAGEPPLYNVEWVNGSSFLFSSSGDGHGDRSDSCTATWHPVGVLPPDWIDGAAYLGRGAVDGFDCHVWTHSFFVRYYQDVATGRPVFWDFVGARRHVLSFEVGGVPEENSAKWQAPASCFSSGGGGNGGAAGAVVVDGHGNGTHVK